ncbi:potassium transporter [Verticiella sediminum]|uniref:Potassium transporter n=1 Tax=Verticiella sediminum TaxID=1247510 RepID=A0A556AYM4_9BURK|nr:monovalent cation:proton antiporter-2 (CPA2) family protein [Verticiella sediminum]TSH97996.1 potassium transporter [Verticiella sediminum]
MAAESGMALTQTIALLGAAVVGVPLFRRLGLGSVLGYLCAGLVIGPSGLALITDPRTLLHVAELGVVLFLFVIGLEMRPSKLWALRGQIFGLGVAQVLACTALLTGVGTLAGLPVPAAFVGAAGFVLSSTAVIMQMMKEAGELTLPAGQRAVSILLLEDLAIVPLLLAISVWAALHGRGDVHAAPLWQSIGIALLALVAVLAAGRWLLDPMFRLLARVRAHEVMTAAALLVVLGAAYVLEAVGLSMAMGAFLAGVLLSESSFRHELEADIEPFRGLLLGLFFLSVGMVLDLRLVIEQWPLVLAGTLAFMAVKALGIYLVARLFGAGRVEAERRAGLFAQGGEFAFVLYSAAQAAGMIEPATSAVMTAIVVLSMAFTPLVVMAQRRYAKPAPPSMEGIEHANGLHARVLVIGFGRFAQVAAQSLLARRISVSLIESDVDMIRAAERFGFKVYYGDGTRLDVLRASGAATAEAILICVDDPRATDLIVELAKTSFPHAALFARAYDRGHVLRLVAAGVDNQVRETFESALAFGHMVLTELGFSADDADATIEEVRDWDAERLRVQILRGLEAGNTLVRNNVSTPMPEPLRPPDKHTGPDTGARGEPG